jgi:hypothetical protein
MENVSVKQLLIFGAALFVSVILLFFGFRLLLSVGEATRMQLFVLGCLTVLCGTVALSGGVLASKIIGGVLIAVGIYFFARMGGLVDGLWVTRLLGLCAIAAAGALAYVAFPRSHEAPPAY